MADSSEDDHIDPLNYKGIYADGNDNDKTTHDPVTGAHFMPNDLRKRLLMIRKQ